MSNRKINSNSNNNNNTRPTNKQFSVLQASTSSSGSGTETPKYGSFDEPSTFISSDYPSYFPQDHFDSNRPSSLSDNLSLMNNNSNQDDNIHQSSSEASASANTSPQTQVQKVPSLSQQQQQQTPGRRKRTWSTSAGPHTLKQHPSHATLFHQAQAGHLIPGSTTATYDSSSRQRTTNNSDVPFLSSDDEDFVISNTSAGLGGPPGLPPLSPTDLSFDNTHHSTHPHNTTNDQDTPYGVLKMEAIARFWGKRGLMGLYAAVYLLSCITSLEGNTTPIVEPFFLSMFHGHSFLATIALITNISYAVGKAPMAKILDVFGRAEGISTAIVLYSSGFVLTAFSSNVVTFGFGRILAALGGQALQLAQQIMIADTSTLTNRGLLTSTISMPWLVTTWLGPLLGQGFKNSGEWGYRAAYMLFGFLLPIICAPLVGILWYYWRNAKRAMRLGKYKGVNGDIDGNFAPSPPSPSSSSSPTTGARRNRSRRRRQRQRHKQRQRQTRLDNDNNNNLDIENGGVEDKLYSSSQSDLSDTEQRSSRPPHHHRHHLSTQSSSDTLNVVASAWNQSGIELCKKALIQLDIGGTLLLTIGCSLVLIPLSLAATRPESWGDFGIYVSVFIGILFLFIFGWFEQNYAQYPILPQRLLQNSTILAGCSLGFFHFACQFAYESYFTSYLQVARYHSAMDAQYIAQSYIFTACIAAMAAGFLAKWSRRYKIWGVLGVLIHIVGALMMVRFRGLENPTYEIVLSQVIGGVGGGFTTICGQLGIQSVVNHNDVAMATAVFLTITQIGGAAGGAMAGGIWNTLLPTRLKTLLPPAEHDKIGDILGDFRVAMDYERGTPERQAVNAAYTSAQRTLNAVALITLIPALISMLCMENVHLVRDDKSLGEGVVVLGTATQEDETDGEDNDDQTSSDNGEMGSLLQNQNRHY